MDCPRSQADAVCRGARAEWIRIIQLLSQRASHKKEGRVKPLTPPQAQCSAQAFLLQSGTPAASTRRAGKGRGRQEGQRPVQRKRFEIVLKSKKAQRQP
jgi:hypothetical protein